MNLHEYVMIQTLGLLTSTHFDKTVETLRDDPNQFEFEEMGIPQKRSLGAQGPSGNAIGLIGWAKTLRQATDLKILAVHTQDRETQEMPAHVLAAFAGATAHLLQVTAFSRTTTYWLNWKTSRMSWITLSELVTLIDEQKNPDAFWERIANKISEFHGWNDLPPVQTLEVRDFLKNSPDGHDVGNHEDSYAGYIVTEAQNVAARLKQPFVIPENFQKYFSTYDEEAMTLEALADNPLALKEYIPEKDRIYLETCPDVKDFVALIEGQKFAAATWDRIATYLNTLQSVQLPEVNSGNVKGFFSGLTIEMLQNIFPAGVFEVIQKVARAHDAELFLPTDGTVQVHRNATYMDPLNDPEWVPQNERLVIEPNPEPFEIFLWTPIPDFPIVHTKANFAEVKADYVAALTAIEKFATQNESPFAEAFRLARHALESLDIAGAGFSDRGENVLARETDLVQSYADFGWSPEKTRALVSASIANVFGGMGSWNDQGLADDGEFEKVSAQAYASLRQFFTAALNL